MWLSNLRKEWLIVSILCWLADNTPYRPTKLLTEKSHHRFENGVRYRPTETSGFRVSIPGCNVKRIIVLSLPEMPGGGHMRHQGLEVSGIRKLVSEREKIDAVEGLTKVLISNFDRLILGKFAKGRRLSFDELRSVFKQADEVFRQKTTAVATSFHHVPGTFARPKSFAAESLYLGVRRMKNPPPGFHDVYQLFGFRLLGTAKCVMLEVDYLPLAFQYHAAERLMERVRDTDAAFLDVARSLAEWSVLLKKAQYTATGKIDGFLNIPAKDNRARCSASSSTNSRSRGSRWNTMTEGLSIPDGPPARCGTLCSSSAHLSIGSCCGRTSFTR